MGTGNAKQYALDRTHLFGKVAPILLQIHPKVLDCAFIAAMCDPHQGPKIPGHGGAALDRSQFIAAGLITAQEQQGFDQQNWDPKTGYLSGVERPADATPVNEFNAFIDLGRSMTP